MLSHINVKHRRPYTTGTPQYTSHIYNQHAPQHTNAKQTNYNLDNTIEG